MIHTIENDIFRVGINSQGGELTNIFCKKNGTEYLYQGNVYAPHRAAFMFPFVGRLIGQKYFCGLQTFPMTKHGFIRDAEFTVTNKSSDAICLEEKYTDDTLKMFPYKFSFACLYTLSQNEVVCTVTVRNLSETEMPFALGFHPSFDVPVGAAQSYSDYFICFDGEHTLTEKVFNKDGFDTGKKLPFELPDGKMFISHELFANDAKVFEIKTDTVRFFKNAADAKASEVFSFRFSGFPFLMVWSKLQLDADFICIEPCTALPPLQDEEVYVERHCDFINILPHAHKSFSLAVGIPD